jgi:RNA polymerase sigma factor (sigma-70 family)
MTDGQLLECFVTRQDEAAFEVLVRRHGPMVLGVCRRVLLDPHDADDAFQATFLVLIQKAASIQQRELLGNWLYGVAYRTALDTRSATARRRAREQSVSVLPEPAVVAGGDQRDLRPLLDQELSRLPDRYREAVVLCDLQGKTRRDAARQLGVPEGTLSGRLTTARRLLVERLSRHGLAVSGGVLLAALSPGVASARVPAPLLGSTMQAARAVAAGTAMGAVSAEVAGLTGGMKAMFVTRWKIATAVLLAAGTILGAALLAHQPTAAQPPARESARKSTESPRADKTVRAPRILELGSGNRGRRVVWSPDGKTLLVVTKYESLFSRKGSAVKLWDVDKGEVRQTVAESPEGGLAFQQVAFSADGKTIAATMSQVVSKPGSLEIQDVVQLWDAKTLAVKQTLEANSRLVCLALSPDGQRVAAGDPSKKQVKVWNVGTGKLERTLETGDAQPWSVAFSPDSKTLVIGGQKADHSGVITLHDAETGKLKRTLELERFVNAAVLSANGRMVAGGGGGGSIELWNIENGKRIASLQGHEKGTRSVAFSPDSRTVAAAGPDGNVRLWDVETGKLTKTLEGHEAEVYSVAFSPDGRTLASVSQDQKLRLWPLSRPGGEKK